jgi:hypothetical protein
MSHTEKGADGRPVVVESSAEQSSADWLVSRFTEDARLVHRKRRRKGYCAHCERDFEKGRMSVALEESPDGHSKPMGRSFHPECWDKIRELLPDDLVAAWLRRGE